MAMALCRRSAVSLTYQHENLRNILRLAPPDSEVGGWTSTILYVLGDGGVFRGWERLMTTSGERLSDRDRDQSRMRSLRIARETPNACAMAAEIPAVQRRGEPSLAFCPRSPPCRRRARDGAMLSGVVA
jgi:hypothetical protein